MALKVGDKVRILIDSPTGDPVEGVVKVVQDEVGKKVGVELNEYTKYGHSLDGLLKDLEKVDPATGQRYGKGWWTLEANVEKM